MIAFYKGVDPREVAEINRRRPSAWTLFKEGLAEGAGKALVEAPIRFGTEIAVDYVSPTRRREREHMTTQENLAASEQAEKVRSNIAAERAAQDVALAAARKAAEDRAQREEASRRSARAFVTQPEVSMPAAAGAPESTETLLPEIRPVVAPPSKPLPSGAQGLLDTFRAGADTAQAREAEQGFVAVPSARRAAARPSESVGFQALRRQGVQTPAVEPELSIDESTGMPVARGYVSERPEAVREAIVIPGSVDSAFDIAMTQARTKKELALAEKAGRQARGGGRGAGLSGRDTREAEIWRKKQATANQSGLPHEAAHADAMQRWILNGRTGPKPDLTAYQPGKSKGLLLDVLGGMAGAPSGKPSEATQAYLGGGNTLQMQRVQIGQNRLAAASALASLKADRAADAEAVRQGRLDKAEAMRRDGLRIAAARLVDVFASSDLQEKKEEFLRGVMGEIPPSVGRGYTIGALKAKLKRGEDLNDDESAWLDAQRR